MQLRLCTLKKRAEFLRIRGGSRWSAPAFVLEMKPRPQVHNREHLQADAGQCAEISHLDKGHAGPRFGLTVTKKLGSAVTRNRIKRRLRAAIEATPVELAGPACDYVIVARRPALTLPFADLRRMLEQGLRRVHRTKGARKARPRRRQD